MRAVALTLAVLTLGAVSAAQAETTGLEWLNSIAKAQVAWGGCILRGLNAGATKIDIADSAVDVAVKGCWQPFETVAGAMASGKEDARNRIMGEARKSPETLRETAIQSAFNYYRTQHFHSAGGQPAASTARSK